MITQEVATSRLALETDFVYGTGVPAVRCIRSDSRPEGTATLLWSEEARLPEVGIDATAWAFAEDVKLPLPDVIAVVVDAFRWATSVSAAVRRDPEDASRSLVLTVDIVDEDYERFLRAERLVIEQLGTVPASALAALVIMPLEG